MLSNKTDQSVLCVNWISPYVNLSTRKGIKEHKTAPPPPPDLSLLRFTPPQPWVLPLYQPALILTLTPEPRSSCWRAGARDPLLFLPPPVSVKCPASHKRVTSITVTGLYALSNVVSQPNYSHNSPNPRQGCAVKTQHIFSLPSLPSLNEESKYLLTYLNRMQGGRR